jgi:sec-independent protein translocase protein TatA
VAGEEVPVFRELSVWHLALILLAFVVLFGYKRLPDATRSLGRSMRIFKAEVKGLHDDEPKQVTGTPATPATPATAATPAATPTTAATPPVTAAPQQGVPAETVRPAEVPGRSDADRA